MANEDASAPQHTTQSVAPQVQAARAGGAPEDAAAQPHAMAAIWTRIQEHKVVQWTLAYAAFGYTVLHAVQMTREALEWPVAVSRITLLAVLLGAPVVVTLAWYHGHRGKHRISGSELSVLTVLLLIAGTLLWRFSGSAREASVTPAMVARPGAASSLPGAIAQPSAHAIAVLPFVNVSADKDQDYFSDGLSDELINALSLVEQLQVSARTSSFSFKGKAVDAQTVARTLHVGTVLEGSVRRSGNTVRVTAQLINAANGFHIWSHTYERDLQDAFAVQAEIATAVAQQLQAKLFGLEASRIEAGGTHDPAAYDIYLRATQVYWNAFTEPLSDAAGTFQTALIGFDQAVAVDPSFAAAHIARAFALEEIGALTTDVRSRSGTLLKARQAAERALALTPDSGEAHVAWANVCLRTLEFQCAVSEYDRALALAPGNARVLMNFAVGSSLLGRNDPAQTAARHAVALDPENFNTHRRLGVVLANARLFPDAIAAELQAKALQPRVYNADVLIARSYLALGRLDSAKELCESPSAAIEEDDRHWCLAVTYHGLGKRDEARAELGKLRVLRDEAALPVLYAELYAQWGDKRAALDRLAVAARQRDPALASLRVRWLLDPVRAEPEFVALEHSLNFPRNPAP